MRILRNTRHFNPLHPEVEINVRSLNIIPLFDINSCNFDLEKIDLNRTLPKNKTARRILINRDLADYQYFSDNTIEYDYTYLKSKYTDYKERLKKSVYDIFNHKVNFLNNIVTTNFQFNEKVYINVNLISDNFQFRGNNSYIKSAFDNFLTKKVIRNNEKLVVYFGSVFKEVDEGTYPVLLSGIDASKINSFKLNLMYSYIKEPTDFNSVKVYVDKDWYLQSCNKSLKTYLLKSLNERYYNYELILFDGKEFANQNMFSYQSLSFSTLAKRKKYFTEIEAKLCETLTKEGYTDDFDYKTLQKEFLDKYNKLLEENRKEKENIEENKPEILETRSLTSEEMSLIDSLFQDNVEEVAVLDTPPSPIILSGGLLNQIETYPDSSYNLLTIDTITDIMHEAVSNSIEYDDLVLNLIPEEAVSQIDNTFADLEDELRRIANEIQNG
jgi:hypothetical protein